MKKQIDHFNITSIEQAKVLSNELRMKILTLFNDGKPRTAKQVADELGLSPSKIHYHVRELVKVDLLFLYDTNEINGIVEKYYLPIAKDFRIVIKKLETDIEGKQQIINHTLTVFKKQFIEAFKDDLDESLLQVMNLDLSKEDKDELINDLKELSAKWVQKSNKEKGRKNTYGMVLSVFPKEDV